MPDFTIVPDPQPTNREAVGHYIVDMIEQLARLARQNGETRIAIHLEAILATDGAALRAH